MSLSTFAQESIMPFFRLDHVRLMTCLIYKISVTVNGVFHVDNLSNTCGDVKIPHFRTTKKNQDNIDDIFLKHK